MKNPSNVVIFGATSAIATAVARQLTGTSHIIHCVGRSPEKLHALEQDLRTRSQGKTTIHATQADLAKTANHPALWQHILQTSGIPDCILIAHGSLPNQKACEQSIQQTLDEINTNALSVISLLTIMANDFEKARKGTLAVITSVAGDRGRQSNYVYGAAKGMVSIFLSGLRNRLYKAGVNVLDIKPGFVDTPMTDAFDKSGLMWAKPDTIAKEIVQACSGKSGVIYTPFFWRWIMLIIRNIPETIFQKLNL